MSGRFMTGEREGRVMGMGIVIVEVCDSNPISQFPLEELEEIYAGVTVLRTECLSRCGLCEHNVYAYVNGHIVFAKDARHCFDLVKQRIEHEFALLDELE